MTRLLPLVISATVPLR